jgi:hypothetical protein
MTSIAAYQDRPIWAEPMPLNLRCWSTSSTRSSRNRAVCAHLSLIRGYEVYGATYQALTSTCVLYHGNDRAS